MIPHRLGFPVKVLGAPLRSHDSRRWQNQPHLSVSLAYLRDVFAYLYTQRIHFYRLAGQLAPYLTHPGLPTFHRQLEECATELAIMGDLARQFALRLTMHPAHHIQLSSPNLALAQRARAELQAAAALLDAMGLDAEAVLVVHVGGTYGDLPAGRDRFVRQFDQLPAPARSRLVLENDDRRYSLEDLLWIHRRTGVPIVLDTLHLCCLNPSGHTLGEALTAALGTWPADRRPKIHVSSPRTALRTVTRSGVAHWLLPLPNQHSDFIDPFTFIELLRLIQHAHLRPFDIMLEAKAKDLALLRLRDQVVHFAPDLAAMIGEGGKP